MTTNKSIRVLAGVIYKGEWHRYKTKVHNGFYVKSVCGKIMRNPDIEYSYLTMPSFSIECNDDDLSSIKTVLLRNSISNEFETHVSDGDITKTCEKCLLKEVVQL